MICIWLMNSDNSVSVLNIEYKFKLFIGVFLRRSAIFLFNFDRQIDEARRVV